MKPLRLLLIFTALIPLAAQAQGDSKYPSLPSEVLSTYVAQAPAEQNAETMAAAAKAFLAGLDKDRLKEATLPYDSPEKAIWTNTPPRGPQGGVRLGDLDEESLKRACDLLAAVLSPQGYFKSKNIPLADDRLLRNNQRRPGFGAEDYWIAIFGEPSATGPWALQFDGHHLAVNLAFHGDAMSMSPSFIGTQPRGFELGEETIEPMLSKDNAALALLTTLSDEQKEAAIIGDTRGNLLAGAGRDGMIPEPAGVSTKDFDERQRAALVEVLKLYVEDLPDRYATRRMEALQGEIEEMTFSWSGPVEEGGDYSYRIQGPTLIIEYAGQDLGGDPHNHLHSIYRDPTNEYGARLGE
ncbi:MAG: DUF3500 domain-containing protein [Verrucomicrobiota bacterium]